MKVIIKCLILTIFFSSSFSIYAEANATKGKKLYKKCMVCHGRKGEGKRSQKAPRLQGQFDWYIVTQLKNMKAKKLRVNRKMDPYIKKLSDQDILDLAAFIKTL